MTPASRGPLVAAFAAVFVLGSLSIWLQAARDRTPLPTSGDETLYLSQRVTGRAVFTHRPLVADLYWIRAVQYFGSRTQMAQAHPFVPSPSQAGAPAISFELLYPFLDIATTLDPQFNIAYRFGAIFLWEEYPRGPGRPDLAIALLEKGLAASPEKWQYWQDIGFVYYWSLHDYQKASAAFRRGADVPGAPWWLRSLAATMLVRGGDRSTSRLLWQQLLETANNDYARNAARAKLMQLKAIDDLESLQAALDRYSSRRGSPVTSWNDLLAAGALRRLPVDPAGVPYELDSRSHVRLSPQSPLNPLPNEPETRIGS